MDNIPVYGFILGSAGFLIILAFSLGLLTAFKSALIAIKTNNIPLSQEFIQERIIEAKGTVKFVLFFAIICWILMAVIMFFHWSS